MNFGLSKIYLWNRYKDMCEVIANSECRESVTEEFVNIVADIEGFPRPGVREHDNYEFYERLGEYLREFIEKFSK